MAERWHNMTPEEREKFREGMRARLRASRAIAGCGDAECLTFP
jgi:hypothetical protein